MGIYYLTVRAGFFETMESLTLLSWKALFGYCIFLGKFEREKLDVYYKRLTYYQMPPLRIDLILLSTLMRFIGEKKLKYQKVY